MSAAYAARYRAARGWADLNQQDLADRLGLEKQVIVRTEGGSRDPKKGELIAVAAVCGVPEEFMLNGFGLIERDELLERLERIEAALPEQRVDYTRVATDEGRVAASAALQSADVAGSTPTAETTRGEEDATPEAPRAPGQATPRTEQGGAG